MRLFIIGTSDDIDITMGLRMLLDQKPVKEIWIPEAEENETHDQVILTASERGIPVRQGNTVETLIEVATKEDVIAFAWDDSDEAFETVIELQDRQIDMFDIADGLTLIDTEVEILEERLSEVLEDFVESLTAIVFKMVMDQVDGDGKFKYRRKHGE